MRLHGHAVEDGLPEWERGEHDCEEGVEGGEKGGVEGGCCFVGSGKGGGEGEGGWGGEGDYADYGEGKGQDVWAECKTRDALFGFGGLEVAQEPDGVDADEELGEDVDDQIDDPESVLERSLVGMELDAEAVEGTSYLVDALIRRFEPGHRNLALKRHHEQSYEHPSVYKVDRQFYYLLPLE